MKYFKWCMPQLERFLNIWKFFYSFLFISIYALYRPFFGKRWFFSWNISSWCMPQLERFLNIWTVYYSYVQDIDVGIFNIFFAICDSLMLCKVHCFGKRWFFHEIFQVGACPNLKDSLIYEIFSIHLYKTYKKFGIFNFNALSATPFSFARYIILEKDDFSWNIFQVGACPNLKDSFLYDRFSIHMYKARIIRYLQQYSSICDSLMPCTVQFCRKRWIFNGIFQVGACPNLKIP